MRDAQTSDTQLRTRRIPYPKPVAIRPRDGTGVTRAEVVDLSLGGMFVSTYLPLEVGQVIDFELQIARLRFPGAARVIWSRSAETTDGQPAGVAVEFLDLSTGQKRLLHREIADFLGSGGTLKVGTPPKSDSTDRSPLARRSTTTPSSGGGLLRRFASMLGF